MFWWRTMARRWSAILVCPWNWQEIASYGLVKRKTPPSVRSAHKHSLNWNIITTWSCWNLGHVGSYLRIRCPELPIQTHHKSTFPPHTCTVCCLGGHNPLHGPGSAGGSGEPQGLRVGFETGGHVCHRPHLLGNLHEMHWPFSRWGMRLHKQQQACRNSILLVKQS